MSTVRKRASAAGRGGGYPAKSTLNSFVCARPKALFWTKEIVTKRRSNARKDKHVGGGG